MPYAGYHYQLLQVMQSGVTLGNHGNLQAWNLEVGFASCAVGGRAKKC